MKRYLFTVLLVCSIFLSGCVNLYVLRRQQKKLVISPEEGVVLFTAEVTSGKYQPFQYNLQEINQYKFYKALNKYIIPCMPENTTSNFLVFGLKLPKGTYKLDSFSGRLGGFFGYQHFLAAGNIFDVTPQKIAYAGRLVFNWSAVNSSQLSLVKDEYIADVELEKKTFPVLQGKDIVKDLSY
ncbi:MAG: hypothetical protein V1670_03525 [Candidatus Omnitrophota bacterium]